MKSGNYSARIRRDLAQLKVVQSQVASFGTAVELCDYNPDRVWLMVTPDTFGSEWQVSLQSGFMAAEGIQIETNTGPYKLTWGDDYHLVTQRWFGLNAVATGFNVIEGLLVK